MAAMGMATVLALAGIGPVWADPPSQLPLITDAVLASGPAQPTQAWIEFCEERPGECVVDEAEPAIVTLDATLWNLVQKVNEQVNAAILPVTDLDHWGVVDRWDYPDDGLGDCEDIQLLKRKLLIEAGLPQRALRMTVVVDEYGEGHAVMMLLTDHGDFVLDNKRNVVLPWRQTGYRYVKREGADGRTWVWLGEQAAPIVTANR
jgi:predicted transglutaminase-like cysteine proteinase